MSASITQNSCLRPEDIPMKPRVLYIPWDNPVHDDDSWEALNAKFDVVVYDFSSIEEYIAELKKPNHGKIGNIDAICRSTWLKSSPYIHHYILRGEPVRLLPDSCKIIVQSGHGYDVADIDYLTSRKIIFCNSPDSCSRATADVGVYLILASYRFLTYAEHCVRTGHYYDSQLISNISDDPSGQTLGIIGLGNIGVLVAKTCQSLGMKIIYHNRSKRSIGETFESETTYCQNLDELFAKSDCILILCPYTKETHHLISFNSFTKMKKKVRIVNIARGPIVQEEAIIDALERGQLVGAGFDVHEFEPQISEKLLNNYKITLLPHAGACTQNSFRNFEQKCVKNLIQYFYLNEKPHTIVNSDIYEPLSDTTENPLVKKELS